MSYIVVLFVFVTNIAFATEGGTNPNPNPNLKTIPQNYTSEGIAQIKQNDHEIKFLFKTIKEKLVSIENKYQQIETMMTNKDMMINCSSFTSIKRDLEDVKKQQDDANNKQLKQDEINHLKALEKDYSMSFLQYKNIINQSGINCPSLEK